MGTANDNPMAPASRYLGDGVYASFDGWHITLSLGEHTAPQVVALEPEVFAALCSYAGAINRHYGEAHFRLGQETLQVLGAGTLSNKEELDQ